MHTGIESPRGIWWKPAHKAEKMWVLIAFGWCMVLFAMMPLWHLKGAQNPSGIRYRVDPNAYARRANEFIRTYRVGVDGAIPIVEPPAGSDVYLIGRMWAWEPVLKLHKGVTYTLHLSSLDVNHGFSLTPVNLNFQVVPGYDYGLRIVPTEAGDFRVVCNEFCGTQPHTMVAPIIVVDDSPASTAPQTGGGR